MASFNGWGTAWAGAWGATSFNPNAMAGSASFSFTATGTLTAGGSGFVSGSASFVITATGTLTAVGQAAELGGSAPALVKMARVKIAKRERLQTDEATPGITPETATEYAARKAADEAITSAMQAARFTIPALDMQEASRAGASAFDAAMANLLAATETRRLLEQIRADKTQKRNNRAAILAALLLMN